MIGTRLGPYELIEEIGKGGMATVFRAYQPNLDRYVAVKAIHRAIAADSVSLERFQREARVVTRLEHPHLLPIYDYDGASDPPYIVMRYLESGTLKDVLDREKLPHEEVIYMLRQVASALDYAHRRSIIHRDIKPTNIMVDPEGNAFLTDFGIARLIEAGQHMTQSGYALGTPGYMSPEQGMGADKLDHRADLYSLAVMTFQMLTGKLPYVADSALGVIFKHISDPIPSVSAIDSTIPPATDAVMQKAMAKQPEGRYDTATDFVNDLAAALGVSTTGTPSSIRRAAQATVELVVVARASKRDQIDAVMATFESSRQLPRTPPSMSTASLPDSGPVFTPPGQPTTGAGQNPTREIPPILLLGGLMVAAIVIGIIAITGGGGIIPATATPQQSVAQQPTATVSPTRSPTPDQTQTAVNLLLTQVALDTQTAEAATDTPTPSPTVTETATPSSTPTLTLTPTPATPVAQALRTTILRLGPGVQYPKVADVSADTELIIIGASEDGSWFKVILGDGSEGWLAFNPVAYSLAGNIQGVPLAVAPTDTPTFTPTATTTATATTTPTSTPTATATATATSTDTPTLTPTNTETATATATPTATVTPLATETPVLFTPTPLPSPTAIPAGRLPFIGDFEDADPLQGWDYDSAIWQVVNEGGDNVLIGKGTLEQPLVILGRQQPEWQTSAANNLVISFSINLDRQSGGARVIFRCANQNGCPDGYQALEIFAGTLILRRNAPTPDIFDRNDERPIRSVAVPLANQRWHNISIWVAGSRTFVYLDRQLVMAAEDLTLPQLGAGAIILQTNSSFRSVRWDNFTVQRPEGASDHFESTGIPPAWETTSTTATAIERDEQGNQYLAMRGAVTLTPNILPIRDLGLSCRVWVEQGGYRMTVRKSAAGSLVFEFDAGNLTLVHLDAAGSVLATKRVNNFYNRGRWEDLNITFVGDKLEIFRDGISRFEDTFIGSPPAGSVSIETRTNDALRLDDCLITETAASRNASARFALEIQDQVFDRPFRDLRSDFLEAFDDQFRTDVFWEGGLAAAGQFINDPSVGDHQKYLRLVHDNRTTFRLFRSVLGVEMFGAGTDTRSYSDSSDLYVSVDVRFPEETGTAWLGIRSTPTITGVELNGYRIELRRNANGATEVIVRFADGTHDEIYFEGSVPGSDRGLPDWIQLSAITYQQRVAFFANGQFVAAVDNALALGGSVALGVEAGTTADFDTLTIRDTTPHDQ